MSIYSLKQGLGDLIMELDVKHNRNEQPDSLLTGLSDLDNMVCGIKPGEIILIAARPCIGKTSLALNIVQNNLPTTNRATIFFSLRESTLNITTRLCASFGGIPFRQIQVCSDSFIADFSPQLQNMVRKMKDLPLYIDDTKHINCNHIETVIESVKQLHSQNLPSDRNRALDSPFPLLIVIDDIQLLFGDQSEEQQRIGLSSFLTELKMLARLYHCPIILTSQAALNI